MPPAPQDPPRQPPRPRAGFREIALAAGVSVTTVDRVLNERGTVSEAARLKVLAAAQALGARRILPQTWHATRRIEVLLPRNPTPFWGALDRAFAGLAQSLPKHVVIQRHLVPENDLRALKAAVLRPRIRRDALIIAADATDLIRPALEAVQARGEVVVTLATGVPGFSGAGHSGIDNHRAGRTAAHLLAGLLHRPGEVVVMKANDRREEHHARIAGFAAVMAAQRPLRVLVTDEREGRTREMLAELMQARPPAAIYATGHNSDEIAPLLAAEAAPPRWISHERSPLHEGYLARGLLDFALDQDPEAQAGWALARAIEAGRMDEIPPLNARPPELRLYCRENIL